MTTARPAESPTADVRRPTLPPPPPTGPARPLRRSPDDRMVAGVAAGIGHYIGIDPVIVRVGFVLLALTGGAGVLLYVFGWVFIPEPGSGEAVGGRTSGSSMPGSVLLGALLIAVGAYLLLGRLWPALGVYVVPLALIAVGAVLLFGGRR